MGVGPGAGKSWVLAPSPLPAQPQHAEGDSAAGTASIRIRSSAWRTPATAPRSVGSRGFTAAPRDPPLRPRAALIRPKVTGHRNEASSCWGRNPGSSCRCEELERQEHRSQLHTCRK